MSRQPECRLAMWAGPPNIATAMMRSWGNRADTFVWDEPFYPYYLQHRSPDHPITREVAAAHETDCAKIIEGLLGPIPGGRTILYQKHMAQYLPIEADLAWIGQARHCLLIRDPREMINNLARHKRDPELRDTGLPQQTAIFDLVSGTTGSAPAVLDATDLLNDPRRVLTGLCQELGVEFSEKMLAWEAGARPTDGAWGKHFYKHAEQLTGFEKPAPEQATIATEQMELYVEALELYRPLYSHRLGATSGA